MKWSNPWDTGGDGLAAYVPSYIEITPSAKVIGANGQTLAEATFGFNPAHWQFFPITLDIDWKQAEEIHISTDISYSIVVSSVWTTFHAVGKGNYKLDQAWRIVYGDNGVSLEPRPTKQLSHGDGDYVVAVQLQPDQSAHEVGPTYVSLLVRLVGGNSDDGVQVGVQVEGVGVNTTVGKDADSNTEDFELKVILHVRGKPEAPAKPADPIVIPDDLLRHIVYFDEQMGAGKRPGEDSSDLSATELRRLDDNWVRPLKSRAPELYAVIKNGNCPITLVGFASNTATETYDLNLSQRRITSVEEAMTDDFDGSPHLKFSVLPVGHSFATQDGAVPREKRVEINIDKQAAQRAIEAGRKETADGKKNKR